MSHKGPKRNPLSAGRTQLHKKCGKCQQVKARTEFSVRPTGWLFSYCKPCVAAYRRAVRARHPHRFKEQARRASVKVSHGITEQQYMELLARQEGKCAICGRAPDENALRRRLAVDHCHESDAIRGLLCSLCNSGLGSFGDNPALLRKAADYIETADTGLVRRPTRGSRTSIDCEHAHAVEAHDRSRAQPGA